MPKVNISLRDAPSEKSDRQETGSARTHHICHTMGPGPSWLISFNSHADDDADDDVCIGRLTWQGVRQSRLARKAMAERRHRTCSDAPRPSCASCVVSRTNATATCSSTPHLSSSRLAASEHPDCPHLQGHAAGGAPKCRVCATDPAGTHHASTTQCGCANHSTAAHLRVTLQPPPHRGRQAPVLRCALDIQRRRRQV